MWVFAKKKRPTTKTTEGTKEADCQGPVFLERWVSLFFVLFVSFVVSFFLFLYKTEHNPWGDLHALGGAVQCRPRARPGRIRSGGAARH